MLPAQIRKTVLHEEIQAPVYLLEAVVGLCLKMKTSVEGGHKLDSSKNVERHELNLKLA